MNKLNHLAEFQELLSDYQMSTEAIEALKNTDLALCVSPSSVGRNTIIRELLKTGKYKYIVSDTTRQPRTNDGVPEQNGVEYWFRTEEEVLEDLREGKFIEAAVIHNQQVSGVSIREVIKAADEGKIGLTDIEVVGVDNIIKAKPDAIALFVLPPTFEEWQRRMNSRGQMSDDEKQRRMESAVKELNMALDHEYFKFVINDTIENVVFQIQDVIENGQTANQQTAKELTKRLLEQTQNTLANK